MAPIKYAGGCSGVFDKTKIFLLNVRINMWKSMENKTFGPKFLSPIDFIMAVLKVVDKMLTSCVESTAVGVAVFRRACT